MQSAPCPSREVFQQALETQIQQADHLFFRDFFMNLYRDIAKAILDFLNSFSIAVGEDGGGNEGWMRVLAIAFPVLLGVLLILTAVVVFRRRHGKKRRRTILGMVVEADATSESLQAEADRHAAEGDFRLAVRCRFIGMLLHLHDNNLLHHDETMTGTEMALRLRMDGRCSAASFERLAEAFNRIWYGHERTDRDHHLEWLHIEEDFWKEVGRDGHA